MTSSIRAILFDKDGTLFSFQETWGGWAYHLLNHLAAGDLERRGDLAARLDFNLETRTFEPSSLAIAGTVDDVVSALSPGVAHLTPQDIRAHVVNSSMEIVLTEAVPLRPLVSRLRAADFVLGVATNDAEAVAREQLDQVGVLNSFAFVAGSDSGFGAKPDPGMCTAFLEATGVSPSAALMVGDSTHDLTAGRAAGMGTVAVLTGPATAEALQNDADSVLPDIGRLPGYLGL